MKKQGALGLDQHGTVVVPSSDNIGETCTNMFPDNGTVAAAPIEWELAGRLPIVWQTK
jgi:hypothetical protein